MQSFTVIFLVLLTQLGASRQVTPATVDGIVIKMGSGEPVAGAKVELHPERSDVPSPEPPETYTATTSQDGKFVLNGVAPGSYRLIATRSGGYVPAEYGQRSPTGQGIPFELSASQRMSGVQLAMAATGVIAGRIYDRDGEPIGRAQVQALRAVYKDGRRALTIVETAQTNERGEYRLFWLTPGRYYVAARPDIPELPANMADSGGSNIATVRITDPARFGSYEQASAAIVRKRRLKSGELIEETSVPVYYPGVIELQAASPVALSAGANVGGVDISIGAGVVPARHIRGRVIDATTGQPLARPGITAIPQSGDPNLSLPHNQSDANGFFDLAGATTGRYAVFATGARVTGTAIVEVGNADVQNVAIVAMAGYKLSGKFVIEGRSRSNSEPRLSDLRVGQLIRVPNSLGAPSGGPSFNPPPAVDGSFTLDGIQQGDFRVTVRAVPPDAYVKSMRLGAADVLDGGLHLSGPPENPLEVVIGADGGRISGSVVNARQEPLPNRIVVLAPDVRLRHRVDLYKSTATDSSGQFQIRGIAPGSYQLFAWEEVEPGAWQDPEFIRIYEGRGKAVQINEGGNENLQVTVIP